MNEFLVVLKKDIKDVLRTNKFFIFMLITLGMTIYSIIMVFAMQLLSDMDMLSGTQLGTLTVSSYENSKMLFTAFLAIDFTLILIILIRNIISKEIAQNKWLLPIQSGIKPQKMVASKLIVITTSVLICVLAAIAIHFIATVILCDPITAMFDEATMKVVTAQIPLSEAMNSLFYGYLMLIICIFMITLITLSVNAITKKTWVSIVVSVSCLLLFPSLLDLIKIGEYTLVNYTPFLFVTESMGSSGGLPWEQYLIAGAGLAVSLFLLVFFAIKGNKIRVKEETDV